MSEEPKPQTLPDVLYVQYDDDNECYVTSKHAVDLAVIHSTETAGQYRLEKVVQVVNTTELVDAPGGNSSDGT